MGIEIEVRALRKCLRTTQALDGVSVDFKEGLMHGVIGPEGAGKTTLFRHIVGLLHADEGEIVYRDSGNEVSWNKIKAQIAYMPQQQSLYPDLSIDEHLRFFRELHGLSKQDYQEKRERLLEITRLKEFIDRPAGKLSGGMYKKLGLMCALLSSPGVLLLDEPTNGVDPISRREFWDLLYQLRAQKILIIVATAYMDEAERCAEVHLLNEGHLIGSGDPKELLKKSETRNFDEYFLKMAGDTHHG